MDSISKTWTRLVKHGLISNSTIDILAKNESKIDDSVFDNEINIIGYNMIRNDRNRFGGGVVLYIRDTISFSERKDLVPEPLEMICIEVRRPHKTAFLVSAWYRPPNSSNDVFNEFDLFLCKCDLENKELMVVGDINSDFAKPVPTSQARVFIPPRTTAKTLVAAGHVDSQNLLPKGEREKCQITCFHIKTLHFICKERGICIILYNIEFSIQSSKCLLFFLYFCLLLNYRTTLLNITLTVK